MTCTATMDKAIDYEFFASAAARASLSECAGPMFSLEIPVHRLQLLEQSFMSSVAQDLLWDGLCSDHGNLQFAHCAAHWFDLCFLAGINAQSNHRHEWRAAAAHLLQQICDAGHWDPREIANLLVWRRVLLT